MYCPNYGKRLSKKAAFCPSCGAAQPVIQQKQQKKKKRKTTLIVLVIVIVTLIALIGSCSSGAKPRKLTEEAAQTAMDQVLTDFFQEASDDPILQIMEPYTVIQV